MSASILAAYMAISFALVLGGVVLGRKAERAAAGRRKRRMGGCL